MLLTFDPYPSTSTLITNFQAAQHFTWATLPISQPFNTSIHTPFHKPPNSIKMKKVSISMPATLIVSVVVSLSLVGTDSAHHSLHDQDSSNPSHGKNSFHHPAKKFPVRVHSLDGLRNNRIFVATALTYPAFLF